jgi:hypothetical protein
MNLLQPVPFASPSYGLPRIPALPVARGITALSDAARRELGKLGKRKLGQAAPMMPIRPSILAAGGLAAFALGSHFVPKKYPVAKGALVLGAVLSGLAGGYFLYAGQ